MKVLLINPPFSRLKSSRNLTETLGALWPACLAASLDQREFNTVIHDGNADLRRQNYKFDTTGMIADYKTFTENFSNRSHPAWMDLEETVRGEAPDVVGISALSPTRGSAFTTAAICREAAPNAKIIFGGYHPTSFPEECLAHGRADIVVRGEGEITFSETVRRLKDGAGLENVAGLSYRDNDGNIKNNPDRPLIDNLDSLPSSSKFIRAATFGKAPLQFGRGCPYSCKFCCDSSLWGRRVRYRSPERMTSDIREIIGIHGVREFSFVDGTFNASPKITREFCELIAKEKIKILWDALARCDGLDDETLSLYRAAGCSQLNIGAESGSERVLDDLGKRTNLKLVADAIARIRKHRIAVISFFCIGMPPETAEDIRATANAILSMPHDAVILHIYTPLPGSEYYERLKNDGLISDSHNFEEYGYMSASNHFSPLIDRETFLKLRDETSRAADIVNRRGRISIKLLLNNFFFFARFPSLIIRRVARLLGARG